MKHLIYIILLVLTSQGYFAQLTPEQEHQVDSLQKIIQSAKHDTVLTNAWMAWDNIIYISDPDLDLVLNQKADSLSSLNLKKDLDKQTKLAFLKTKGNALNNIGTIYKDRGDYDKAIEFQTESKKILEEIGDKKGVALSLNSFGNIYSDLGDYNKAIQYYTECQKISEEIHNKEGMASSFNNIGLIYYEQGNYAKSIVLYTKSLKISEEIGDKEGIAISLNNIGSIHREQGDYTKAIEYYSKSIKIEEELGNSYGIAYSINNIGLIYADQGDYASAIEAYNKSLKILKEIGYDFGIAYSLNNIGNVYRAKNDYAKAIEYYSKSLEIKKKLGDKKGIANSLNNIGNIYYFLGDYAKAFDYSSSSLLTAQEVGAAIVTRDAAYNLWEVNKKMGHYKEGLDMYELYIAIRDSLEGEENLKETIRQEYKYEYEKQVTADSIVNIEAEKVHLANLKAEKALGEKQKTEIAAQKRQNIYLFVGLGLVALFGFFMYNRFKVTHRQKLIIEDQKAEVEAQKITIEKTLQELETTHVKLESNHEQLEESHKEITDSINYAERIQRSFLASKETLDENLKDYFVFFKPKEAVSGDFYWAAQLNDNNFAFTVADSTGHGVPGAIMSLLNITSLEKSVETEVEPHKILNKTREIIVNRLSKDGSEHGGKDGMDCNLMVLNKDKSVLTFASANNTIVIIREGEILEYKGDKMPVGKHDKDTESFTLHSVQLQKEDVIYALTDGFPDQFGGPKGKKYMIKNLKNKFLQIASMPMKDQEIALEQEFSTWKEDNEQIDDVCIIGVRV